MAQDSKFQTRFPPLSFGCTPALARCVILRPLSERTPYSWSSFHYPMFHRVSLAI